MKTVVLLQASNISKWYSCGEGYTTALESVSIAVHSGDFLMVTGPSGSGKSTFLNILSGLDSSSEGDVVFMGESLGAMGVGKIARLRNDAFGFIFQTPHLLPDRTVLENVALPFQYGARVSLEKITIRCQQLLEYVGLNEMGTRFPNTLSGGEMQRVVVARALARKPKLIFADEPTGSLDSENSQKIVKLLQEQAEAGCAIVMATHDTSLLDAGSRRLKLQKNRAVA